MLSIELLLDCALKATALLTLAFLILHLPLPRRASAATRHLLWSLTLAGLLILPPLSLLLPGWHILPQWTTPIIPIPISPLAAPPESPAITPSPAPQPTPIDIHPLPTPIHSEPLPAPTPPPPPPPKPTFTWPPLSTLLNYTYLLGMTLSLLPVLLGYLLLWNLQRKSPPLTDPAWTNLLHQLSTTLGMTRPIRLLQSPTQSMPVTWGLLHPIILLPRDAENWPEDRRRCVLLHELAHIRRHDALSFLLARLACTLYWFHPLAWFAAARLRAASELACDDMVLAAGTKSSTYAHELVTIAQGPPPSFNARAAIAMARANRPSQLHTRITAILDQKRNRRKLTFTIITACLLLLAGVVLPLATIRSANKSPAPFEKVSIAWRADENGQYNQDSDFFIHPRTLTLTNPQDLQRLMACFPTMEDKRTLQPSETPAWGLDFATCTFTRTDGTSIQVKIDPACKLYHTDINASGRPIQGDLAAELASLLLPQPAGQIAWGAPVDGIQIGVRVPSGRYVIHGEGLSPELWVRKMTTAPSDFLFVEPTHLRPEINWLPAEKRGEILYIESATESYLGMVMRTPNLVPNVEQKLCALDVVRFVNPSPSLLAAHTTGATPGSYSLRILWPHRFTLKSDDFEWKTLTTGTTNIEIADATAASTTAPATQPLAFPNPPAWSDFEKLLGQPIDAPAVKDFAARYKLERYFKFDSGGFDNNENVPFTLDYNQDRIGGITLTINHQPQALFPNVPLYRGTLPGGIEPTDTPDDVIRRLGQPLEKPQPDVLKYHSLTFTFFDPNHHLTEITLVAATPSTTQPAATTKPTLTLQLLDPQGQPLRNEALNLIPITTGPSFDLGGPFTADKTGLITINSLTPGPHEFVLHSDWPNPTFLKFDLPPTGLKTTATVKPASTLSPPDLRPNLNLNITVREENGKKLLAVSLSNNTARPYTLTDTDLQLISLDHRIFPSLTGSHAGTIIPAKGAGTLDFTLDWQDYEQRGRWMQRLESIDSWKVPATPAGEGLDYYRLDICNCYSTTFILPKPIDKSWGQPAAGIQLRLQPAKSIWNVQELVRFQELRAQIEGEISRHAIELANLTRDLSNPNLFRPNANAQINTNLAQNLASRESEFQQSILYAQQKLQTEQRLLVEKRGFAPDAQLFAEKSPTLKLDVRNTGKDPSPLIGAAFPGYDLELDGKIYHYFGPINMESARLQPGQSITDIPFALETYWGPDFPKSLTGKHTIRAIYMKGDQKIFSNPATFEIVPDPPASPALPATARVDNTTIPNLPAIIPPDDWSNLAQALNIPQGWKLTHAMGSMSPYGLIPGNGDKIDLHPDPLPAGKYVPLSIWLMSADYSGATAPPTNIPGSPLPEKPRELGRWNGRRVYIYGTAWNGAEQQILQALQISNAQTPWGKAVDGIQLRLQPVTSTWNVPLPTTITLNGQPPVPITAPMPIMQGEGGATAIADIDAKGNLTGIRITRPTNFFPQKSPTLQLDIRNTGTQTIPLSPRHLLFGLELDGKTYQYTGPVGIRLGPFKPGDYFAAIDYPLASEWGPDFPKSLTGIHTIRAMLGTGAKAIYSNLATVEILPDAAAATTQATQPAAAAPTTRADAWSNTAHNLRARFLPPSTPFKPGDKPTITLEVQNASDKPLYIASYQALLNMPDFQDKLDSLILGTPTPGKGARTLTVAEISANLQTGFQNRQPTDTVEGFYLLDPGGSFLLKAEFPFTLPKPGTYKITGRVPGDNPRTNRNLDPSEFMVLPEITLTVAPADTQPAAATLETLFYQQLYARYRDSILAATKAADTAAVAKTTAAFNDSLGGRIIYAVITRIDPADKVTQVYAFHDPSNRMRPAIRYAKIEPVHVSKIDDYILLETSMLPLPDPLPPGYQFHTQYADDIYIALALAPIPAATQPAAATTHPAPTASQIAGRLVDYLNQPVAGATILIPTISEENKTYIHDGKIEEPSGNDILKGASATTDKDGYFLLDLIPQSTRTLLITAPNYLAWIATDIHARQESLITLPKPASFKISYDIAGAPDSSEFSIMLYPSSIPGGKERLYNASTSINIRNGQEVTIPNLPPGTYDIQRRKQVNVALTSSMNIPLDWPNKFELASGETKAVDFARHGPRLTGRVTGLAEFALTGATIQITEPLPENEPPTTTPRAYDIIATGPDGAFTTEPLPPGKYTLSASTSLGAGGGGGFGRNGGAQIHIIGRLDITVPPDGATQLGPLEIALHPANTILDAQINRLLQALTSGDAATEAIARQALLNAGQAAVPTLQKMAFGDSTAARAAQQILAEITAAGGGDGSHPAGDVPARHPAYHPVRHPICRFQGERQGLPILPRLRAAGPSRPAAH